MVGLNDRNSVRRAARCGAGFSLVEMLVAFAILGVSLVSILQALSGGMLAGRRAPNVALLALEAQSLSARLGLEIPLHSDENPRLFELTGSWTVTVEESSQQGRGGVDAAGWALYRIRLSGRSEDGSSFEMTTYKTSRQAD